MILRVPTGNPAWMSTPAEVANQAAGKVLLVSMLVIAGFAAAAAPLVADLLSAVAGLLIVYFAFAAWTTAGQVQKPGRTRATNLLEAA